MGASFLLTAVQWTRRRIWRPTSTTTLDLRKASAKSSRAKSLQPDFIPVYSIPTPIHTHSIMSEAESKTEAPPAAEEKTAEEIKGTKRAAEVGQPSQILTLRPLY